VAASSVDGFPQDISPEHYTIERELGRGGMATVYVARDTKHGRRVALKVLKSELAASLGAERFRREITLAASLQHPHIVPVHDSGETTSGVLWFTMPLIEGESLRDRLRRQRQLSIDEAVRITREVALALDYAHRHGVIHRDIKPENILLVDDQAMVADFGIARAVATAGPGGALTATGMAVGTPAYMSPEQAAGERAIDARTDIYSLGVVLYEMLAGEPPYTGPTAQAIAAKMLTGDVPSVRRSRPSVPEAIDSVIRQALSPVPADRFASGAAFASALQTAERVASAPPATPQPSVSPGAPVSRRRISVLGLVLGLSVLVCAGALFAWWRTRSNPRSVSADGPVALAVLPFESGSDTANTYFAEGIADEIRGKLAALPALQVISRASSNDYRHTRESPAQIAGELGVRYLLTGTVQWERSPTGTRRVRVSPELMEINPGRASLTKWQQSYDTTLADVFDVQAAVATQVADKLGLVLSAPAETRIAARPTKNLAAYDAYLRSRSLDQVDLATQRRALAAAEQAVALDSGFAAAWARVAFLHATLYGIGTGVPAEAEAARRAADRALALEPSGSDGHWVLGVYYGNVPHDLAAARSELETAVKLDPKSALAVGGLGLIEAAQGQLAAGLEHARHATTLDPRLTMAAARLSWMLLRLRRYRDARAEAERGLAAAPTDLILTKNRATSFLGEGDLVGARAALRDAPPTLDRSILTANFSRNQVSGLSCSCALSWTLDSADRALLLTLPPSAFDRRDAWALVLAQISWLLGDTVRARHYADSARAALERERGGTQWVEERWDEQHALALAYLGRRAEAIREGEHGLALARATGDGYWLPHARHVLARLYVMAGDYQHAIVQLDSLLAEPYPISPAWLKIDPTWAPLHGDPAFERLLSQPPVTFTSQVPESAR
jgi:serine/threonine-protein kinase